MSITIIDRSAPPAPIYKRIPTPNVFLTTLEEQTYFAKKMETWIDGVGEMIDGKHELPGTFVFACDEGVLKHRQKGNMGRYEATDGGLFFHQHLRKAKAKQRAAFFLKGRGFGLSTEGMGILPYYVWKTQPGSTVLSTSKGMDEIFALYTDKFKPPINPESSVRMDPRIFSMNDYDQWNENKKNIYVSIKVKHLDEDGLPTVSLSELYCKETAHSDVAATGFSGKGGAYAFLDEYPLHPRRSILWASLQECLKDSRQGPGIHSLVIMGGTCEIKLTSEEILELYKFWENAEASNIERCFLSACWNKHMVNGHSNFKKFEEEYEQECELKIKDPDPNVLLAYQRNNPITEKDVWKFAQGKYFVKEAMDILEHTAIQVSDPKTAPIIVRCDLINKKADGRIEENKKPDGLWHILERPEEGADYFLLIDGIATGKITGNKDGSNVGAIMFKGYSPLKGIDGSFYAAAVASFRPDYVTDSYPVLKNAFHYYNQFGGFQKFLAEGNAANADHFSEYLKAQGLNRYIPYREISGKGSLINTNKPFQYVTIYLREFQIRQANPFLILHGHKQRILPLLVDLLKPKDDNSDLRDAFLQIFSYLPMNFYLPVKKKPDPPRQQRRVLMNINGVTRYEWV
jgi:hypothetical protein